MAMHKRLSLFCLSVALLSMPAALSAQWSKRLNATQVNALVEHEGVIVAVSFSGVHVSTDKGQTWGDLTGNLAGHLLYSATVVGENLLVGTLDDGLYQPSSTPEVWVKVEQGLNGSRSIRCLIADGSSVYAGAENGLFRSDNGGLTWTSLSSELANNSLWAVAKNGGELLVGGYTGVVASSDPDSSWISIDETLSAYDLDQQGDLLATPTGAFKNLGNLYAPAPGVSSGASFTAASFGTDRVLGGDGTVHYSADDGATFRNITGDLPQGAVLSALVAGDSIFVGTTSGVYSRSRSGVLSVHEKGLSKLNFRIAPNPASQIVTVYGDCSIDEYCVEVLSVSGVVLLRKPSTGCEDISLDVQGLSQGSYLCRVVTDKGEEVMAFQVVR
jgi:hypothetical protein